MKKFILLLFFLPFFVMGRSAELQSKEELHLIEKLYYDRGVYIASEEEREKLHELIYQMRADSTLRIQVIGYSDKWGGDDVNKRFSYVRAMYIADWIGSCRVPREQIIFVGEGIDSEAVSDTEARRVEISQVVTVVIEPEPEPEPVSEPVSEVQPQPEPQPEQVIIAESESESELEPITQSESSPELQAPTTASAPMEKSSSITLRTNLFYWLGGLMNVGAEYRCSESDFGYLLNAGYSFIGGANWEHSFAGWFISPEVRYYIPSSPQWFVGVQALAGGFNFKLSDTGRQGVVFGGGVTAGYKVILNERFDMDFNLGLGYGSYKYDIYHHSDGVNIRDYKGLKRGYLLPQAGVNLIWKIK